MADASVPGGLEERSVSVGGRTIRIRSPAGADRMVPRFEGLFFQHARFPYWAQLWPASVTLADLVLSGAVPVAGKDVLEVGAGLGLPGIAAGLAGARWVMFSDFCVESLELCVANAELNGLERFQALYLDWRRPIVPRRYEVVIGSDVVYDVRDLGPLLATLEVVLAPGGEAFLVSDPERAQAAPFLELAAERGFSVGRTRLPSGKGAVYRLGRSAEA